MFLWGLLCAYIVIAYISPKISSFFNSISTNVQKFTQQEKKPFYAIELDNDLMIVTIPQFTVGISGFNEIDWGELNIMEVVDDIFQKIKTEAQHTTIKINISMYFDGEDKYGNKYYTYRLYELMTVNTAEIKRYKNSSYFEKEYNIVHQIIRLPFDKQPIKELTKNESSD